MLPSKFVSLWWKKTAAAEPRAFPAFYPPPSTIAGRFPSFQELMSIAQTCKISGSRPSMPMGAEKGRLVSSSSPTTRYALGPIKSTRVGGTVCQLRSPIVCLHRPRLRRQDWRSVVGAGYATPRMSMPAKNGKRELLLLRCVAVCSLDTRERSPMGNASAVPDKLNGVPFGRGLVRMEDHNEPPPTVHRNNTEVLKPSVSLRLPTVRPPRPDCWVVVLKPSIFPCIFAYTPATRGRYWIYVILSHTMKSR